MTRLLWFEAGLFVVVLLFYPAVAWFLRNSQERTGRNLDRALYLPNGSIRAMLALIIVGSFLNVLVFGANHIKDHFTEIIAAFGTLSGSVTGFYFGTRGSQQLPPTNPTLTTNPIE